MGGMLAPRLDSALIFISRRRGVALLDCQPHRQGRHLLEVIWARVVASLSAGGFGSLPALDGPLANQLHDGRHAHADWVRVSFPLPVGLPATALGVDRTGCDPDGLLAGVGALSRGRPEFRLAI